MKNMQMVWKLQNNLKSSSFVLLCILLFVYFAFYTINGERGLLRYLYLKKEISQTQKIATEYHNKKSKLGEQVRLLSSSSLDLDLLDERTRDILNFVGEDEYVILDSEM